MYFLNYCFLVLGSYKSGSFQPFNKYILVLSFPPFFLQLAHGMVSTRKRSSPPAFLSLRSDSPQAPELTVITPNRPRSTDQKLLLIRD